MHHAANAHACRNPRAIRFPMPGQAAVLPLPSADRSISGGRPWLFRVVVLFAGMLAWCTCGEPWSTYLHDPARSGVTADALPDALELHWRFEPPAPPAHAWADPQPKPVEGILELPRLRFDDAYHVAIGNGIVTFGSSSDHKVYALEIGSGRVRWEFFTEGPVRSAPTLDRGRLYLGSDDGFVYCLDAESGRQIWRMRAGPADQRVLGNGQLVSLWPVRTGVAVIDGIAYAGAGVFPMEGLYLHAIDADSGDILWTNDRYGRGGNADVSPQGCLVLTTDVVVLPSGRRSPMIFDRQTGRLRFNDAPSRYAVGPYGGTYTKADEDRVYNGTESLFSYSLSNGRMEILEQGRRIAPTPTHVYLLTGDRLVCYDKARWIDVSRKRFPLRKRIIQLNRTRGRALTSKRRLDARNQPIPDSLQAEIDSVNRQLHDTEKTLQRLEQSLREPPYWEAPCTDVDSMLVAANAIVTGGDGRIQAFAKTSGKCLWEQVVPGRARGLALSDGRLVVSSDTGTILCMARGKTLPATVSLSKTALDMPDSAQSRSLAAVLADHAPESGFGLVIGCEAISAIACLAERTRLKTYALATDQEQAAMLRHRLNATGRYGYGTAVLQCEKLAELPLPDYMANLIVWTDAAGPTPEAAEQLLRVLKPWGGLLLAPTAGTDGIRERAARSLTEWSAHGWTAFRRGELPGAGSWTHQYAEPGNSASGDDRSVRAPLGVLWYGEPGPGRVPNRHASAAAPLAAEGRMFIQGEEVILCYDSSNGVLLWERSLPGALRTGLKTGCSNLAYGHGSLFVVAQGICHALDPASGETRDRHRPPASDDGRQRPWGEYIAVSADLLIGTVDDNELFAIDLQRGDARWSHSARNLDPITIAADRTRLFYVDRDATETQQRAALAAVDESTRLDRYGKPVPVDVRVITCLDLRDGHSLWEAPQYVSDCVKIGSGGGQLTLMVSADVVLLCGQPWNGHFWQEFFGGQFSRRSLIALSASDGRSLWSDRKGYRSRPIIVENTIIAEPWAYDLHTGSPKERSNALTGLASVWQFSRPGHHCGNIVGSPHALFFRSGSAAYYDLVGDYGTTHFGGQRPGCWINCIPANGVVLMPEASSGCICPYSLHCTTVFHPRREQRGWGRYSATGPFTPIKDLRINFDAPGDRRDLNNTLWLAYPRPGRGRLILPLDVKQEFYSDGQYAPGPPGRKPHWLYDSGAVNLRTCRMTLLEPVDGTATYTIRLHLSTPPTVSSCVRSIRLRNQAPIRADIARRQAPDTGVWICQIENVPCAEELIIAVEAASPDEAAAQPHILHALEIVREKVLHVGMTADDVVVNNAKLMDTVTLHLGNFTERPFRGTVRPILPDGLSSVPETVPISLNLNQKKDVRLQVGMAAPRQPAIFPVAYQLMGADGTVEHECRAEVDYLGNQGRRRFIPTMDTYVSKRDPGRNWGSAAALLVDGGNTEFGDAHHSRAFLHFSLEIPGTPTKTILRLYVPEGGHTHSSDSGVIRLVAGDWDEHTLTHNNAPEPGPVVAEIGKVDQGVWIERILDCKLAENRSLTLILDPRGLDGASYSSRESNHPPELIVEYTLPESQ